MTASTAPITLLPVHAAPSLHIAPALRPGAGAGRLPVDDVVSGEDLLTLHLAVHDALEDQGALRAQRREALLHRLQLDRQRRRRRSA